MNGGNSKEIVWRAAEYEYIPKDVGWYWVIGGVAAILVGFALSQKNFPFALFIALAAVLVMIFGSKRPQVFEFKVSEEGVGVGKSIFYPYDGLESFSVRSRPRHLDEIVLKKKTLISPFVRIPIDSKLLTKVQERLKEKLPETEYQESLIDVVSEWLGF